jgi:hypothetical protein
VKLARTKAFDALGFLNYLFCLENNIPLSHGSGTNIFAFYLRKTKTN